MRLRKALKHINPIATYCHIYEAVYIDNDDYEEIFSGDLFDIPWWIAEKHIDTDINGEGIALTPKINRNEHGVEMVVVDIYVRGEKKWLKIEK